MALNRASSPLSSIVSSLPSCPPSTWADNLPNPTSVAFEGTLNEMDASHCEFDIDWENIWHGGKRLVGVRKRPHHKRVVGTKIKESWIYQHGANLEYNGVHYWLCKICHEKKSYSTVLYASSGMSHAAKHLLRQHQIGEFGENSPNLKTPFSLAASSASSSSHSLSRQASLGFQLASCFNEEAWKARFVDWIILEDITF